MLHAFKPLCGLVFAGLLFGPALIAAEETASAQKSDKAPEAKPDAEKPKDTSAAIAEKPSDAAQPANAAAAAAAEKEKAEQAKEDQARLARQQAQKLLAREVALRAAVRKLSTPGWKEARATLIAASKEAVPYLIEAMNPEAEDYRAVSAFMLGGHTKADSGREPRQRPLSEVCAEILTDMVTNHSTYRGELPTLNAKEWQTWWTANGVSISFGQEAKAGAAEPAQPEAPAPQEASAPATKEAPAPEKAAK